MSDLSVIHSTRLTIRSEEEISAAIRAYAEECLKSDDPIKCIKEFQAKLLAKNWDENDLRYVHNGIIHVLVYLTKNYSLLGYIKKHL